MHPRFTVVAIGVAAASACALNRREIARIPRYEDSWDCVVQGLEEWGFTPASEGLRDGRLRLYQGLEYVELEEAEQDGRPVLVLHGSTGFMQSVAASAADEGTVGGASRREVTEVARACGPGLLSRP